MGAKKRKIIFFDTFDFGKLGDRWHYSDKSETIKINYDPRYVHSGACSMEVTALPGKNAGGMARIWFMPDYDKVHVRWYCKFGADFDQGNLMHLNKFLYRSLIWIVLVFSGLVLYGIFIEPYQVEIHHVRIENARWAKVLEGKIVLHLSDLHIDKLGKREQKVLEILEEMQPDFVFLTGDYTRWNGDNEAALAFLSGLKAKVGVWAVMGDYDYSRSIKKRKRIISFPLTNGSSHSRGGQDALFCSGKC